MVLKCFVVCVFCFEGFLHWYRYILVVILLLATCNNYNIVLLKISPKIYACLILGVIVSCAYTPQKHTVLRMIDRDKNASCFATTHMCCITYMNWYIYITLGVCLHHTSYTHMSSHMCPILSIIYTRHFFLIF